MPLEVNSPFTPLSLFPGLLKATAWGKPIPRLLPDLGFWLPTSWDGIRIPSPELKPKGLDVQLGQRMPVDHITPKIEQRELWMEGPPYWSTSSHQAKGT